MERVKRTACGGTGLTIARLSNTGERGSELGGKDTERKGGKEVSARAKTMLKRDGKGGAQCLGVGPKGGEGRLR